jgi:hypothetical protein
VAVGGTGVLPADWRPRLDKLLVKRSTMNLAAETSM